MKTDKIKRTYFKPQIEIIKLDKDISLTLNSYIPPDGPGEGGFGSLAPEYLNNDPFKSNLT